MEGIGFWLFMLICCLLLPGAMAGFGAFFLRGGPGKVNILFGYRTNMSMKNEDTWRFAHQRFGRLWLRWGIALLPMSAAAMLAVLGRGENAIGAMSLALLGLQLAVTVGCIAATELALRREFLPDGSRRR